MKKIVKFILLLASIIAFVCLAGFVVKAIVKDHQKEARDRITTDVAVVLSSPVSREGYPAYSVFLKGAKIHSWIDASDVNRPLKADEELAVKYDKDKICECPHLRGVVKPVSP